MINAADTTKKRLFIAPLDWGLGHASRLVPLISEMKEQGHFILLGTDVKTGAFLKKQFPDIPQIALKGYGIRYASQNKMHWKLLIQIPRLCFAIAGEYFSLKKIVRDNKIEVVISDSRFGLRHKKTQNFILSHQLHILYPPEIQFLGKFINNVNRYLLNAFDVCLIPDFETHAFSGILSQNTSIRSQRFIGPLSRFSKADTSAAIKNEELIFVLSGPEPQRSVLEQIIINQLKKMSFSALLISGQPEKSYSQQIAPNIRKVAHLSDSEFAASLKNAQVVFSRSGYSSIMDYAALNLKQIVLIPTPGQTEQEYLARKFSEANNCFASSQKSFSIQKSIEHVKSFHGFSAKDYPPSKGISSLLSSIEEKSIPNNPNI